MPGQDAVYVVDQGKKRGIPSAFTYEQLFRSWNNIHLDIDIEDIDTAPNLDMNSCLFKCFDDYAVFLLDNGKKRHIVSPAVMDRFEFDWKKVHIWNVSLKVLGIPDGPEICMTGRPD